MQIIEHDVAVYVDEHGAGHRFIPADHVDIDAPVDLRGMQAHFAHRTRLSLAGEGDAQHPRAAVAHAEQTLPVDADGGIQVERSAALGHGGGEQQPGAGCARGESRKTAEGVGTL